MNIAIASDDASGEGSVSARGGRAPYYLLYDGQGKLTEALKNPFAVGGGGAGFSVAKMLADHGVDICVAGEAGGNMTEALEGRGIRFVGHDGPVAEALRSVIGG